MLRWQRRIDTDTDGQLRAADVGWTEAARRTSAHAGAIVRNAGAWGYSSTPVRH